MSGKWRTSTNDSHQYLGYYFGNLKRSCVQIFYEFFVFRFQNRTITHALSTFVHFLLDAICSFVTVVFITEVTKYAAGRLRPDFLQVWAYLLTSKPTLHLLFVVSALRDYFSREQYLINQVPPATFTATPAD